jgi:hypothetical protein
MWPLSCREHDGRFTLPNVLDMLELGREQSRLHQPYELAAQMSGFCTLQMWQALSREGGVPSFVEWYDIPQGTLNGSNTNFPIHINQYHDCCSHRLCKLLQGPPAHAVLRKYPGKSFVNRKSLRLLHRILDVQVRKLPLVSAGASCHVSSFRFCSLCNGA